MKWLTVSVWFLVCCRFSSVDNESIMLTLLTISDRSSPVTVYEKRDKEEEDKLECNWWVNYGSAVVPLTVSSNTLVTQSVAFCDSCSFRASNNKSVWLEKLTLGRSRYANGWERFWIGRCIKSNYGQYSRWLTNPIATTDVQFRPFHSWQHTILHAIDSFNNLTRTHLTLGIGTQRGNIVLQTL